LQEDLKPKCGFGLSFFTLRDWFPSLQEDLKSKGGFGFSSFCSPSTLRAISELARRSQAQMWVLGCRLFALRVLCEAMISELARRSQVQMWVCG
jgi:hypothetical protein